MSRRRRLTLLVLLAVVAATLATACPGVAAWLGQFVPVAALLAAAAGPRRG